MYWPADHPLLTDETLRPWESAAADLCDGARVVRVLRHLPGRRVATLLRLDDTYAVLKVFASPRARGNDRRLRSLAAGPAASIVPASLGIDPCGHVHLVSYHAGVELDRLSDVDFVASCRKTGIQLRRLHDCGAELDRSWGWREEAAQLRRQALPTTLGPVGEALLHPTDLETADWVCAHRDCHPGQVIVEPNGDVRWIDLDDCAMAPRALDAGNMVAHLRREHLRGTRPRQVSLAAERQFLIGYGSHASLTTAALDRWTDLAMLRLAALAATRHRDWLLHDRLLLARKGPNLSEPAMGPVKVSR